MAESPTQRTLALLRKNGYTAAVVERWNAYVKIRQDLFGFADLVAIHPDVSGTLYVQTTSGDNHSARVSKIVKCEAAKSCVMARNRVQVISWSKKKNRWTPRIQEILLGDFEKDGAK